MYSSIYIGNGQEAFSSAHRNKEAQALLCAQTSSKIHLAVRRMLNSKHNHAWLDTNQGTHFSETPATISGLVPTVNARINQAILTTRGEKSDSIV